ncbi:hypothetical protein GCM10027589_26930 [Actinocorallia lasiicapitis]
MRKKFIGGTVLLAGLSVVGLVGAANAGNGSEPTVTCSTQLPQGLPDLPGADASKNVASGTGLTARNEDGTVVENAPAAPPAGAVSHEIELKDGQVLFDGKPAPAGSGCDADGITTVTVTEGTPPAS